MTTTTTVGAREVDTLVYLRARLAMRVEDLRIARKHETEAAAPTTRSPA